MTLRKILIKFIIIKHCDPLADNKILNNDINKTLKEIDNLFREKVLPEKKKKVCLFCGVKEESWNDTIDQIEKNWKKAIKK